MGIPLRLMPNETVTVKSQGNLGSFDVADGMPVMPQYTERTEKGNFQPLSGRERLLLPEADRERDAFNFFTQGTIRLDELVIRQGVTYEVLKVEDWRQQRLSHLMAVVARKDD